MRFRSPFASIVVPTRNRPQIIEYCLQSLQNQTYGDIEVIVVDNHTGQSCKEVFDRYADSRFQYVVPPSPLAMHDNWEFACTLAKGEYVTILIDKFALYPSAIERLYNAVNAIPAEVVTWWNESYWLTDEYTGYENGLYKPQFSARKPDYFDPKQELCRRFQMDVRRGAEGNHYFRGKICFGAYHYELINRVRQKLGRVFFPLTPDYTSMIAALSYTNSALDIGQPLQMSFMTELSNGNQVERFPHMALQFLEQLGLDYFVPDKLPVAGLYSSLHNIVAHDYVKMKDRIGAPLQDIQLNWVNLLLRTKEDIDQRVVWSDLTLKKQHYEIWQSHYNQLSAKDKRIFRQVAAKQQFVGASRRAKVSAKSALRRTAQHLFPKSYYQIRSVAKGLLGGKASVQEAAVHCKSMREALQLADHHYTSSQQYS